MLTKFQNHASNTNIGMRQALQTAVMVLIEHSQHIGDRMKRDAIFQMSIISPQLSYNQLHKTIIPPHVNVIPSHSLRKWPAFPINQVIRNV